MFRQPNTLKVISSFYATLLCIVVLAQKTEVVPISKMPKPVHPSGVEAILSKEKWNILFPHRLNYKPKVEVQEKKPVTNADNKNIKPADKKWEAGKAVAAKAEPVKKPTPKKSDDDDDDDDDDKKPDSKPAAIKPDFYNYAAFVQAARYFPAFASIGSLEMRKRELAAFLANISEETTGGKLGDTTFKWGLVYLEEINQKNDYVDLKSKNYPPVEGQKYFGRGPKQMSWNYNYGQFSEAWYGDKNVLLKNPDLVISNPVLAFASALWFWNTAQHPKPSCHDVMVGAWIPNAKDSLEGRMPGFGVTLNIINGGYECGSGIDKPKAKDRYGYYRFFCKYFQVSPGNNITCKDQKPFGYVFKPLKK